MQTLFDMIGVLVSPSLQKRCESLNDDKRFSRVEYVSEAPWDYLHQWRLECYPEQDVTEWTRLSLRIWMIFVQQRFLLRGAVEWHLPFTYGDATRPRSKTEYATCEVWGNRDITVEEFVRTSEAEFVNELPPLYSAFENALERRRPLIPEVTL